VTRLEGVQLILFGALQAQTRGLDALFIERALRLARDVRRALEDFDPKSDVRNAFFSKDFEKDAEGSCAPPFDPAAPQTPALFVRFFLAQVFAENNAVSKAAADRDLVRAHPELVGDLDDYARQVATFDFRCAKRWGASFDWRSPSYLLDSAGGYWGAKGENFGVSANDPAQASELAPNSQTRVAALCDARTAYLTARRHFDADRSDPVNAYENPPDPLDEEAERWNDDRFALGLQSGFDRADKDLAAIPAAEIAEACNSK